MLGFYKESYTEEQVDRPFCANLALQSLHEDKIKAPEGNLGSHRYMKFYIY